jgi:hypothetical protein
MEQKNVLRKKRISSNTTAVSIVQDTLLFLVFISISAMILSPALLPSNIQESSMNKMINTQTQDALQTLLSSTRKQYSYRSGAEFIDSLAETIGVNTSQTEGIYASLTNHILGKQQYHKTTAQLITEQLATQYQLTLNESTLHLNPFSGDAYQQLTEILNDELTHLLPGSLSFNFTAVWQPIKKIPFGGKISIGQPIPTTVSTFSTHQSLSMPFLPKITIQNKTFYFSSYHLKESAEMILSDVQYFQNISFLQNETVNVTNDNSSKMITENLSSFFKDILFHGVMTTNQTLLFPSVLNIVLSPLFFQESFFLFDANDKKNPSKDIFQSVNSFFDSCTTQEIEEFSFDISASIISSFGTIIQDQLQDTVLTMADDFLKLIKNQIIQLIQPLMYPYIEKLIDVFLAGNQTLHDLVTDSIDVIFSHLSLSSASISLTVWRG